MRGKGRDHGTRASAASGFQLLVSRLRRQREQRAAPLGPRRPHWLAVAGTAVLLAICAAGAYPFVRAHLQAAAVLDQVSGQPVPTWLARFSSYAVTSEDVDLPGENGTVIRARVYTPVGVAHPQGLVVLHGVHHLGMNEPRLVAFARAMSACGLRVLTPQLPGIADYHVSADSIRTIGGSTVWLARDNPEHDLDPVGVMGLSFSGGLSLLAAADPVYHPAFKFIVAIGSQDEMSRVASYYRTGSDAEPDGKPEVLPPHEYGALVMEYEHLDDFVPARDVTVMRALLRAHLYEDVPAEKALRARLTPGQTAEAEQLLDSHSPVTRALLAGEEKQHLEEMAGVSPHGHLATLDTPVFLLHGAGDNIIPAAETMWMAGELPHNSLQSVLISPVLSHLDMDGASPSAMDRWRLVHFFALLIHAAETPPAN